MRLSIILLMTLLMLTACQNSPVIEPKTSQYSLKFLTKKQYYMVSGLVDGLLPKIENVGVKEMNVVQFIDQTIFSTKDPVVQEHFSKGADQFELQLKYHFQVAPEHTRIEHYRLLLSLFFSISAQKQQQIFSLQNLPPEKIPQAELYNYYLYKFLLTTRELTLQGNSTYEYVDEKY
jgi:hypothetical protein